MFPFQETRQVNEELRRRVRECLPTLDEAMELANQWNLRLAVCKSLALRSSTQMLESIAGAKSSTGKSLWNLPSTRYSALKREGRLGMIKLPSSSVFLRGGRYRYQTTRQFDFFARSIASNISLHLVSQYDDPLSERFIHLARISMMLGEDIFCSRSLLIIYSIVSVGFPSPLKC
jgi:hypothetical protein